MVVSKQRNFEETKRTPHYGLRKLNVGVASVLLGVTVFGINVALDPAKAAANVTEPVTQPVTKTENLNGPTSNVPPTGSGQNTATAGSGQNTATTGSGQNTATTGKGQNPGTVDENHINTQTQAKNNQLAKEKGLTSSDNSSSNIYKGTDGNYYKVVTIYGKDYVYRPVKVYANGSKKLQDFFKGPLTEGDTRTNIVTSKEDLGNGKVRWTVVFFPAKGLTREHSAVSGLQSAKFGIALTNDYQIIGDVTVNIDSIADADHAYTAMDGHGREKSLTPEAHVVQSFNPNTDVDLSGWINSSTMPGENNDYILGPYYFTTANSVGEKNLGNTFFKEETVKKNAYTNENFVGEVHDLWTDSYIIKNEDKNALDGGDYYKKHLIYDPLFNERGGIYKDGFFNSGDFGSAMIFKSQGKTGSAQFSSFTISFVAQHTDSYQSDLAKGPNGQQFSGIIANTFSFQNDFYNMYSSSLGEQRSLKKVGAEYVPTQPEDVVSNWEKGKEALAKIKQDYLNKSQIDTLSNAIHSNIDDEDTVDKIVTIGNNLNDAMKKLGNSVGQYDDQNEYADHVVDTVKQSDRYLNADKAKRSAYDQAVEAAKKVLDKEKGQYAEQPKVEDLTNAVNDAWKALNGSTIPTQKVVVADPLKLTPDELDQIKQKVAAVNPGTTVEVASDGSVTIKSGDQVLTPIAGDQLVIGQTKVDDPKNLTPTEQGEVKQKVSTAYKSLNVTNVTISNDGTATVTLPSGPVPPIPGTDLVVKKTDTEKYTAETGAPVDLQHGKAVAVDDKLDPSAVVIKDQNGSQVELPAGAKVVWTEAPDTREIGNGKTGQAKVVYGDGTESAPVDVTYNVTPNQADTNTPEADKVTVNKGETPSAQGAIKNNKDLPEGTKYEWKEPIDTTTPGDKTGTVVVTYPDGSKDTVDVPVTVRDEHGQTQADKNDPKTPGNKVEVDDPTKLTDDEKGEVVKAVEDANKDDNGNSTLPDGTKITVDDNGDVTVTYPDGSEDTIPGDKVVEGKDNGSETGDQTDAEKNNPAVPGDKVKVDDPAKLTDDEKEDVVKAVEDANKDDNGNSTLPDGTKITIGDNGDVTVTYPDGSEDTIPGDKVVEGKTDADKNEPNVPSEDDKVKVDDPTKLTDDEKNAVKDKVDQANPNLPDGTKVTVGDDGTTTITYPDGSTNTIPGHDLVTGKTDADKYPLNPGQAVDVVDPNHLTQAEQDQVKEAIRTANPTAPIATITVDAAGNVQVTFADGSTTTLQANLHKHVTEATTGSATKPGAGTNGDQTKGATSTNQTATKQQAQQHLPQTGDQPATWAMLSGLGVAFLGLLGLKKKRED